MTSDSISTGASRRAAGVGGEFVVETRAWLAPSTAERRCALFGSKKKPDPAKVAEREAMVAKIKADAERAKTIIPRLKELDDFGGLHTEPAANLLAQNLDAEETLDAALWGERDSDKVLLAATSRRVLLIKIKMFGNEVETIEYSKITGIQQERGLIHGKVVIAAGLSTIEVKKAFALHVPAFVEAVQANASGSGKSSAPAAVQAVDDPADQLRKFAALRDEGILTEDEFAAKKRQLLGLE